MQAESHLIILDAHPEPVEIACERCTILVIDLQNDFGARGGMFDRADLIITPIECVMQPRVRVLAAARSAVLPVIYLKMLHSLELADTGRPESPPSHLR